MPNAYPIQYKKGKAKRLAWSAADEVALKFAGFAKVDSKSTIKAFDDDPAVGS